MMNEVSVFLQDYVKITKTWGLTKQQRRALYNEDFLAILCVLSIDRKLKQLLPLQQHHTYMNSSNFSDILKGAMPISILRTCNIEKLDEFNKYLGSNIW